MNREEYNEVFEAMKEIVADMHSMAEDLKRSVEKMQTVNIGESCDDVYFHHVIHSVKEYYAARRAIYGLDPMSTREEYLWNRIDPNK